MQLEVIKSSSIFGGVDEKKKNKIEKVSFKAGFQRRDPVFFVFSRIIFWKNKGSHVVYNIRQRRDQ